MKNRNELEFLIYSTPHEDVRVNVVVKDETLWLTQKAMAELFGIQVPAISKHLKNIFAECSIGYTPQSQFTRDFYAMVQNKFHFAIAGKTAAEIIFSNADHAHEHMGLTTWKNMPDGRILKSDTTIAKNYLSEAEIKRLERAVSGYFDYVEDLIEQENAFTMKEFSASVNEFLAFRKYKILDGLGKISKLQAERKAEKEYDVFNKTQQLESDFDRAIKKLKEPQ